MRVVVFGGGLALYAVWTWRQFEPAFAALVSR
jgi:hypothetical protein